MVETTFELPVIDLTPYLADPSSPAALAECEKVCDEKDLNAKASQAFLDFSACSVLDPRVSEGENAQFLDLLEDYFDQPTEAKLKDARPELSYQVGATPENIEFPRCGRDPKCLKYVEDLGSDDKPFGFDKKDPKWRFVTRFFPSHSHHAVLAYWRATQGNKLSAIKC